MELTCRKCGSNRVATRQNRKNPNATDLYCCVCGAWIKFANPAERRIFPTVTVRSMASFTREEWGIIARVLEATPEVGARTPYGSKIRELRDRALAMSNMPKGVKML